MSKATISAECPYCHQTGAHVIYRDTKKVSCTFCSRTSELSDKTLIPLGSYPIAKVTDREIINSKKNVSCPNYYKGNQIVLKEPDGSKALHNIRDHGKFGSYPSFEPMDDD